MQNTMLICHKNRGRSDGKTAFSKNKKKKLQNSKKKKFILFTHCRSSDYSSLNILSPTRGRVYFNHGCWASPSNLVYPKISLTEMTLACTV